jgi:AraC-like DNA-binding protein
VSTLTQDYSRGTHVPQHAHGSDQLIYASRGVMQVASGQNLWIIPPHFALWIPARTAHEIRMPERVSMRTLYLRPGLTDLAPRCTVLHVGPLLRELIFEIVRVSKLRTHSRIECALRELLVAQLEHASAVPTGVGLPKDQRALTIAQWVLQNPGLHPRLTTMCDSAGVSVRTLERVFLRDVGTDFESWRRQVRLMRAIELLISGSSVKEASYSVGYRQPTAFVTLFRATFGTTPKAWVSALERLR